MTCWCQDPLETSDLVILMSQDPQEKHMSHKYDLGGSCLASKCAFRVSPQLVLPCGIASFQWSDVSNYRETMQP